SMVIEGSSDFPEHCFVPLQSALDYSDAASPLSPYHNIISNPVSVNMSRTFGHVLVGWRTRASCYQSTGSRFWNYYKGEACKNADHMQWRKDYLTSVSEYASNYLAREIGDEFMYLDNMNLNREAIYEAKNTLSAGNDESLLYFYPTHGSLSGVTWDGMHSDDQNFIIDSFGIGTVEFTAGNEIKLRTGFESRRHSRFWAHIDTFPYCLLTFIELGGDSLSIVATDNTSFVEVLNDPHAELVIYPNPSEGNFTLKSIGTEITHCLLTDTKGAIINSEIPINNPQQLDLDCRFLSNGIYLLKVYTSDNTYR